MNSVRYWLWHGVMDEYLHNEIDEMIFGRRYRYADGDVAVKLMTEVRQFLKVFPEDSMEFGFLVLGRRK